MPIAAGATNLFLNRDTKVFLGESLGKPLNFAATAASSNALTTTYAHGLTTGERIVFSNITGLTGPAVGTIYYAINASSTTFKVATTLANAIAGTAVTTTGTPTAGTTYAHAVDSFVSPTTITPGSNTIVVASTTAMFRAGDTVQLQNINPSTDASNLIYSGVYVVASITAGTSFTLTATGATATGAFTSPTDVQVVRMSMWEIPVLAGYAMTQGAATSEVTLNEMVSAAGTSRRGRQMFNDAMSPTEWSFDTYVRPFKSTNHYTVEEPLWAGILGNNVGVVTGTGTSAVTTWGLGVTRDASALTLSFANSNVITLTEYDIFFVLGANKISGRNYTTTDAGDTLIYKVGRAVVNEASLTFDIDGITSVSWSGMGRSAQELGYLYGTDAASGGISNTNNFIRNRLTQLTAVSSATTGSVTYGITLTGGGITISNNITYVTPETLGVVNKPLAHVAGNRTVSGNFTAYMDEVTNGTVDLFQNLAERYNTVVQNSFALDFYVGGQASSDVVTAPGIQFTFDNAHLEIPSVNFDDVISTEVNFHALPSTIGGTDEIGAIRFIGQ